MTFTVVTDGRSDRALIHLLRWVVTRISGPGHVRAQWADFGAFHAPPKGLAEKINKAIQLYPADLLFVHRDAESANLSDRRAEILRAVRDANVPATPAVCVVPVRMTEAWFPFDESAIREAAGNPGGREPLQLPPVAGIESHPDPKAVLRKAMLDACGLRGRRRRSFEVGPAFHRLAEIVRDYSPLERLTAFRELNRETRELVAGLRR